MTHAEPGMSFFEKRLAVPKLTTNGENQWTSFFKNLLAVPKPAINRKKPWTSHFQKRSSVPNSPVPSQELIKCDHATGIDRFYEQY